MENEEKKEPDLKKWKENIKNASQNLIIDAEGETMRNEQIKSRNHSKKSGFYSQNHFFRGNFIGDNWIEREMIIPIYQS